MEGSGSGRPINSKHLKIIEDSARHLIKVTEKYLDFSSLASSGAFFREHIKVSCVLEDVVLLFQSLAKEKRQMILCRVDRGAVVYADKLIV